MEEKLTKLGKCAKDLIHNHIGACRLALFVLCFAVCTAVIKEKCLLLYNWQCVLLGLFCATPVYIVPFVCAVLETVFPILVTEEQYEK